MKTIPKIKWPMNTRRIWTPTLQRGSIIELSMKMSTSNWCSRRGTLKMRQIYEVSTWWRCNTIDGIVAKIMLMANLSTLNNLTSSVPMLVLMLISTRSTMSTMTTKLEMRNAYPTSIGNKKVVTPKLNKCPKWMPMLKPPSSSRFNLKTKSIASISCTWIEILKTWSTACLMLKHRYHGV